MTQVAVPVLSVTPVQVSDPLSVKVTGSSAIGVFVVLSVNTADTGVGEKKLPLTGLTVRVVGVADTTVGLAATAI